MASTKPVFERAGGEPRRIEIHLGAMCNNRCIFCVSGDRRDQKLPWAEFDRVKEELERFYAQGCRCAGFLGGEPTVYPHILDCVAYAKKIGFSRIVICTNGTRLSDKDFCDRLVKAGLTRVTLSVHSHKPEIEDKMITNVPGNLARKVAAIGNLIALKRKGLLKDNISLNPVLCRPPLPYLEEYIAFFEGLGVDDIRFNFIWPHGDVPHDKKWIPTLRETMPRAVRVMLLNEKKKKPMHLTFGAVPKCALGLAGVKGRLLDHLASKYLDDAVFDPPNDVSMADSEGRPQDRFVWQERKRDVFKTMLPECRDCRFYCGCDGIWKSYAELYGLGELKPL